MGNRLSEEDAERIIDAYVGQVNGQGSESDEDSPEEDTYWTGRVSRPSNSTKESTPSEPPEYLKQVIQLQSGCKTGVPDKNVYNAISERETYSKRWGSSKRAHISQRFLPQEKTGHMIKNFRYRGFCGQYSSDGSMFMSGTEGRSIRFYDTKTWKETKEIIAGLEIRDTDYSPDQRWLVYSGWSSSFYLCNVVGEHETHDALLMGGTNGGSWGHFCLFSIKFSPSSDEIIGGSSDNSIYVYDLNRKELNMRVEGHSNDVNSVCYVSKNDSNMILSGGDDCLIKLWDRRVLGKGKEPVGIFSGHNSGITHISSKLDGVYFISNGKDQCTKLFDIRKGCPTNNSSNYEMNSFDYRMGIPRNQRNRSNLDTSLLTYKGHLISKTLIRCYFTPLETTGQKYIVTGSADGSIYIYDTLTTQLVKKLKGHQSLVRDISFHPSDMSMVSTSWDTTLGLWSFGEKEREFFPRDHRSPYNAARYM